MTIVETPIKVNMERIMPLREYFGSMEILGHNLPYHVKYTPAKEKGLVDSILTWSQRYGILPRLYTEINGGFQKMLSDLTVEYEAKLGLLRQKMAKGITPTVSGGSFSKMEKLGQIAGKEMDNIQISFDRTVKISKDLEEILRHTSPSKK